jgi:hypothetical protein
MTRILLRTAFGIASLFSVMQSIAVAEDYAKPTMFHEAMAHEVGTWDGSVSMWMSPEVEPMKSKAVETNSMLGKFWLMSDFESEFNGEKFTGASAMGYDPVKKKFVGGWVDSMSPFMMKMEGEYDEDAETLTMIGEATDFMTGKPGKHKLVTKYTGKDTKTFTMYREGEGGDDDWQKTLLIEYTRKK